MNYIRGAVNAISAPYQYYKDINPATLTGAIDVIVIQRPADNGGTELACSPFHVRFGKWQVLRPSEKKVTVSVNGHPIPFDMKIGEAGEAFFIFETEDDVPEDLITSPLLRPSSPTDENARGSMDVETTRYGTKKGGDQNPDAGEPEPLDLNALPSPPEEDVGVDGDHNANTSSGHITTPTAHKPSASTSSFTVPSIEPHHIRRRASTVSVSIPHASSLPSPPPSPTRTSAEKAQDARADASLKQPVAEIQAPEIRCQDGIALDTTGYHSQQLPQSPSNVSTKKHDSSHDRERSDQTIHCNDDDDTTLYAFPSDSTRKSDDTFPGGEHDYLTEHTNSQFKSLTLPFPSRAVTEPPPDLPFPSPSSSAPNSASPVSATLKRFPGPGKFNVLSPVQEYSWEWGAFPTPSPMKSSFGKGGRFESGLGTIGPEEEHDTFTSSEPHNGNFTSSRGRTIGSGTRDSKGKSMLSGLSKVSPDDEGDNVHARSMSVPPGFDESPTRERQRESLFAKYNDADPAAEFTVAQEHEIDAASLSGSGGFGSSGKLSASKSDPTVFKLLIEGKKVEFELSLVEYPEDERNGHDGDDVEGESDDHEELSRGIDEFETARLFEKGKISFEDFIQNDQLVRDPRLVLKWTRQQFISQRDGSPLMDALAIWRDSYILRKGKRVSMRPVSPISALDEDQEGNVKISPITDPEGKKLVLERSKSEPPEEMKGPSLGGVKSPPPTSSSWAQWWRRSRKSTNVPVSKPLEVPVPFDELMGGSAPALPSTPVHQSSTELERTPTFTDSSPRKYAKTLRLTSDQLKSLNLKPGPNSITFSLHMSGVVACTARIFLWDSTDLVVISDIDGTITKSDGLGHVFAMIGRDWTHLGVAKLYTDITRNGYKIMYLTSRAIGQADATRGYLKGIKQNDYQLPEGPVIMSPDRLMASLHREVIMRKPEVFKMACLRDIQRLFGEASRNPFYAGFGNRITDALSYRTVNVPSSRIFTIDSAGEVKCELLELAGYKSSYIHMTDLVDQMFPPIHRKWAPEFTDFNFWKPPMQEFPLPDFSPPSPALSARSDSSTFARIRNFSLVGTRQNNIPKVTAAMAAASSRASDDEQPLRNMKLPQMSSFERLSSTLGFSGNGSHSSILNDGRRSDSPDTRSYTSSSYAGSEDEEDDGGWNGGRRERRRSTTSMPGSLEDMNFGDDDEEEYDPNDDYNGGYDRHGEDEVDEVAADDAFDEDLLAAGEMKNVPFL
ncbi:nuclear elongation and deformation protein 1 [Lentinula aff. lateritia]|uniref:Nuclear elongation and deformation protein 1 n=1 Tax=Lentinula aff. lateritia TaxID=2804960 RepID=A0ACC1TQL6_9AGAR|nr:nuclear elongation and deformation protein 1 [Lentinula aff. lateritia]